jgi:thioredoxin 1
MFQRSVLLVSAILVVVFASAFTSQWMSSASIPSSYDTGIRLDEAFQTTKTPILVEFYSDACGTCQQVAPMVDSLKPEFKDKLKVVMVNTDNNENATFMQLFKVDTLPALFVFDPKKMKKQPISPEHFATEKTLQVGIHKALDALKTMPDSKVRPFG